MPPAKLQKWCKNIFVVRVHGSIESNSSLVACSLLISDLVAGIWNRPPKRIHSCGRRMMQLDKWFSLFGRTKWVYHGDDHGMIWRALSLLIIIIMNRAKTAWTFNRCAHHLAHLTKYKLLDNFIFNFNYVTNCSLWSLQICDVHFKLVGTFLAFKRTHLTWYL
jgi:hypothetical protein